VLPLGITGLTRISVIHRTSYSGREANAALFAALRDIIDREHSGEAMLGPSRSPAQQQIRFDEQQLGGPAW
jgi:hypothetical protein